MKLYEIFLKIKNILNRKIKMKITIIIYNYLNEINDFKLKLFTNELFMKYDFNLIFKNSKFFSSLTKSFEFLNIFINSFIKEIDFFKDFFEIFNDDFKNLSKIETTGSRKENRYEWF